MDEFSPHRRSEIVEMSNASNIKVSIVIPTYNREKFITECIKSAQEQSYPNIEIVVSDNASTDSTWQICQELARSDSRIVMIRNEVNLGPVRNWMKGIEKATGDYCKILFSDDCLAPDCLEKMVPKLADPHVGFVYCAANIGATLDSVSSPAYALEKSKRITPNTFTDLLINGAAPVSPGAVLLRTEDVRSNLHLTFPTAMPRKFENNGAGPDAMSLLLTAQAYAYIEHLNEPLAFFRAHPDSFTISNTNYEVARGYQSAIAYFLKHYQGRTPWLRYLARVWRQESRRTQSKALMQNFLIEYEGDGSLSERFALVWQMTCRPVRKLIRGNHVYTN